MRGDAGAQALDRRITQCGSALGRVGILAFWVPARRDLVMQLLVGSGAAVLNVFSNLVPQVVTYKAEPKQITMQVQQTLENLVEKQWRLIATDCGQRSPPM